MSRAELNAQEHTKKISIFRQILKLQDALNGVFIQRIMANDLRRLLNNPQDNDPVAAALGDLSNIFQYCTTELGPAAGQAVASSVDIIVQEAAADKAEGENGEGCVLLAWKVENTGGSNFAPAALVGIATLFRMKPTDSFSTLPASFRNQNQYDRLVPFFNGENNGAPPFPAGLGIKRKYMYIDIMCSKKPGVGRLLVLHAYRYSIIKKTKGLLALSFSKRPLSATRQPASYKTFRGLGFQTVIENTNYSSQGMYGHWVAKSTSNIDFSGVIEELGQVCTRTGYTDATSQKRIWRCPV